MTLADEFPKMRVQNKGGFSYVEIYEKNKEYILGMVTIGLFGIAGLLLVPVVKYIIKVANHYPKVFRWIFTIIFAFICIHGFLFTRNWNIRFVIICIGAAITINSLNTNSRQ